MRHHVRRSAAAAVLVQQPVRRVPDLPRVRQHHRARHGSRRARSVEVDPAGRDRAVEQAALSRAARGAEARRAEGEDPARRALVGADRRGEAVRHRGRRRRCRIRRNPRLLPLARAQEIQGARPRVPEPLSRLPDLPRLRRRAAAARSARRAGRRPHHRSGVGADRSRGARRSSATSSSPRRKGDRRQGAEGDPAAAVVPERRRAGLPDARSAVVDAVGRRSAAHQPGDVARVGARRHAVRARRAVDRPALARQPAADRHPAPASRSGQHGARRRARRRHDQGRRSHRRSRASAPASRAAASCFPARSTG